MWSVLALLCLYPIVIPSTKIALPWVDLPTSCWTRTRSFSHYSQNGIPMKFQSIIAVVVMAFVVSSRKCQESLVACPINRCQAWLCGSPSQKLYFQGFVEGDILFEDKAVSLHEGAKWSDGIIPFVISDIYTLENSRMIARALSDVQSVSCLTFVDREDEDDYISFEPVDGCSSKIGRSGGKQIISLTDSCFFPGVILHEIMHTLGFWHEHNRFDRDEFVIIQTENIRPGFESNFEKYSADSVSTMGEPYDYGSIMHGSSNMMAVNASKTIVPYPDETTPVGQRVALSDLDILKLNKFYDCPLHSTVTTSVIPVTTTTVSPITVPKPDLGKFCEDILGYDLVPNPYDCTSFFVCWNGITQASQCPDGLYFNPLLDVCDWPGNVACTLIAFVL